MLNLSRTQPSPRLIRPSPFRRHHGLQHPAQKGALTPDPAQWLEDVVKTAGCLTTPAPEERGVPERISSWHEHEKAGYSCTYTLSKFTTQPYTPPAKPKNPRSSPSPCPSPAPPSSPTCPPSSASSSSASAQHTSSLHARGSGSSASLPRRRRPWTGR